MHDDTTAALSFGARIDDYRNFRIAYPSSLFEHIDAALPSARGVAVDLGSGTGITIDALESRFARVVAVEPDARMAARIEARAGLEITVSRAEDVVFPSDSVDLIACGTAFYWMDGPRVLERAARWLRPGGLLAVFRYTLPDLPINLAECVDEQFHRHWNTFRHPRLLDEDYSWRVISRSLLFTQQARHVLPHYVTLDAAALAGFFASTSYVGAYLRTQVAPGTYLERLTRLFDQAAGGKPFRANFATELILANAIPAEDDALDVDPMVWGEIEL